MKTILSKKITFLIGILAVICAGAGIFLMASSSAEAQTCPNPGEVMGPGGVCGPASPQPPNCPAGEIPIPNGNGGCMPDPNAPQGALAGCTNDPVTGQPVCPGAIQPEINCDWNDFQCGIAKFFYYAVYVTFGTLVFIAASFFDFIISLTILDFHKWAGLPSIKIAWTVLRDTLTITFIFLLLYAAISMIAGLGKEKGIIKGVILAGLFINFSFFFTSVIIDISNTATVQMHEAIKKIGNNIALGSSNADAPYKITGITAVFMRGTGIQVATIKGLDSDQFVSKLFQQMFFSSILFLVLAFVFFAMGFLLLGRFIILLILLITSPVSVMGGLLPQLKQHSKKWWDTLIAQATFAPIMMLFLVVTSVVVSNQEFRNSFSKSTHAGLVGGVEGLAQYAIVIGLLVMSIIIAKKGAGAASNGASDWAVKKAQNVARAPLRWGGAAVGAVAGGASGAVGRLGVKKIVNPLSDKYNVAMGNLAAGNKLQRGIAAVARGTRIDEGIRDTFKGVAAAKFGSNANLEQREKQIAQRTKEINQSVKDKETREIIEGGIELTTEQLARGAYDSTNTDIQDYLKTVAKITDQQIEEMLATGDIEKLKKLAPDLAPKHMDKINSSMLISDKDKGDIGTERTNGLKARLNDSIDRRKEAARLAGGNPNDVAQLPTEILKDAMVAERLSVNALSKIANGKMNDSDRADIRTHIESAISDLPRMRTRLATLKAMPTRTATENEMMKQLSLDIPRLENAEKWLASPAGTVF